MTQFQLLLITIVLLSTTWLAITVLWANHLIKKSKEQVLYYQDPNTQIKIAQHVISSGWYQDNVEVFK